MKDEIDENDKIVNMNTQVNFSEPDEEDHANELIDFEEPTTSHN